MEEYKIARRLRDIAVTPIFAGSNEIMKVIIAKNLGCNCTNYSIYSLSLLFFI